MLAAKPRQSIVHYSPGFHDTWWYLEILLKTTQCFLDIWLHKLSLLDANNLTPDIQHC